MNAYVVKTKDQREYADDWIDFGDGLVYPILASCQPIAPVVAATPAQAKKFFLEEYAFKRGHYSTGVETDDWPNLCVRLLAKDVVLSPGLHERDDELWIRIHEVEDHGGKPCDCPDYPEEEDGNPSPTPTH